MTTRTRVAVAIAIVVLIAAALIFWQTRPLAPPDPGLDGQAPQGSIPDDPAVELRTAELFFPGAEGRLEIQPRDLPNGDVRSRIGALVAALIEGPGAHSDLLPIFPAETVELTDVFLLQDGTAVIDLSLTENAALAMGSTAELLSIYSLVNTVVLDDDEIHQVVLLWAGKQPETFSGHIDTTRPLKPETTLIARR